MKERLIFLERQTRPSKIMCEEIKLKGYSQFRFCAYKLDRLWFIHELTTGHGLNIGYNKTLAAAKKAARQYLEDNIKGDKQKLTNKLRELGTINGS
jgi:hypothetical protein